MIEITNYKRNGNFVIKFKNDGRGLMLDKLLILSNNTLNINSIKLKFVISNYTDLINLAIRYSYSFSFINLLKVSLNLSGENGLVM